MCFFSIFFSSYKCISRFNIHYQQVCLVVQKKNKWEKSKNVSFCSLRRIVLFLFRSSCMNFKRSKTTIKTNHEAILDGTKLVEAGVENVREKHRRGLVAKREKSLQNNFKIKSNFFDVFFCFFSNSSHVIKSFLRTKSIKRKQWTENVFSSFLS